jgi:tRNA(Ile)-lysidine synthase
VAVPQEGLFHDAIVGAIWAPEQSPSPRQPVTLSARHALVLAVSGGSDSVALLRAARAGPTRPLVVAHLNHGLRGEASDADERFVADLAAQFGLPFVNTRRDLAALARSRRANLEATARAERYAWLGEVARAHGCAEVATGHTADDQAETVLHALIRGSDLPGLRGSAARRPLAPGVELVRPLLGHTRADLRTFLAKLGQPFREDESNFDCRFTRNRLRHGLLPLLARADADIVRKLCRLAELAGEAHAMRTAQARVVLAAAELPRAGPVLVLAAAALAGAPRSVLCEAFRLVWRREGWPCGAMTRAHWERVAAVAQGQTVAADLPGRVRVRRRGRVVQVGPEA